MIDSIIQYRFTLQLYLSVFCIPTFCMSVLCATIIFIPLTASSAQQAITPNQKNNEIINPVKMGSPTEKNSLTVSPPKGFSDLLEPQLTSVDIFYNSERIGSSIARYTPENITFESPKPILALIPNLIHPKALLDVFSLPFNNNQSAICHYKGQLDCGTLSPETIAIIFNEELLRVDVFINPKLIEKTSFPVERFLPNSNSSTSMINAISLIASSGDDRDKQSKEAKNKNLYTAQLNTTLSKENFRTISSIEADDMHGVRLDELSFIYENKNRLYQLGSFRTMTQNSSFFEQNDFLGLRVHTSLNSRTDLEQRSATPLYVFLNERSKIDIFKDGQLIDSGLYQPGNTELDSRSFPQGAYTVELKITGDSGRTRTESHFYSKSLQLPPVNETTFFTEIGYPEKNQLKRYPKTQNQPLARFGIAHRPVDSIGISGALSKTPDEGSIEFGSVWLANQLQIETNHALMDNGAHAAYYSTNFRSPWLYLSSSFRKSYNDKASTPTNVLSLASNQKINLIPPSTRQTQLSIGIPLYGSILNLFARNTENKNMTHSKTIGLSWRKNLFRKGRITLDWSIDVAKEQENKSLLTGFTLRFLSNHYNLSSNAIYNQQEAENTKQYHTDKQLQLAYRNQDTFIGALNNHLDFNQTKNNTRTTFQSEIHNEYGYGRIGVDHIKNRINLGNTEKDQSSEHLGYSLTSRFNIVSTANNIAMGGSQTNAAGVMIDLTSIDLEKFYFTVIINGIERAKIKTGKSSFIALPAYSQYEVILSPEGKELVTFDNTPRQFTLYPGNVKRIYWDIDKVKVIIMQLQDDKQIPLSNALLSNSKGFAYTDDLGWIQMEIKSSGSLSFKTKKGKFCNITIAEKELPDMVNYLGIKQCNSLK